MTLTPRDEMLMMGGGMRVDDDDDDGNFNMAGRMRKMNKGGGDGGV